MNDLPIDPRFEKLVALLYGELSAEEERQVRAMIAADEPLRQAWEDLVAARTALHEWEAQEPVPSFVFLREEERAPSAAAGTPGTAGRIRASWKERLRAATMLPWATAAAALVISLLAIGDFRVIRSEQGWSVGFGAAPPPTLPAPQTASLPPGDPGEVGRLEGSSSMEPALGQPAGEPVLAAADGTKPYLTKDEFQAYATGLTQTVVALLNDYGRERDREVAGLMQAALTGVAARQTTDYRELKGRLEAVQFLLQTEEQARLRSQFTPGMQSSQADSAGPVEEIPADESEE
jgi:hypothetical protein